MTVEQIMELADSWMYARLNDGHTWSDVDIARDALRTAIEELHRDAARYREIRKGHALTVKMKKTVGIYAAQSDKDYPEALDAAIDAAMKDPT